MADALPAEVRDLLQAVLGALAIPSPATIGDTVRYREVLDDRALSVRITLEAVLRDRPPRDLAWETARLREQLAGQPPTGYVTAAEAHAALAEGKSWMEAVRPKDGGDQS